MSTEHESGPSIDAIGDDPRWHRFTPMAWQAVAMNYTGNLPSIAQLPKFDHPMNASGSFSQITTAQAFSAALQLARYGLGWGHGAKGFAQWSSLGFPSLTSHLNVIRHLLGGHAQYLADWLNNVSSDGSNPLNSGGYDSYHLESHSRGPERHTGSEFWCSLSEDGNQKVLVVNSYLGWYHALSRGNSHTDSFASSVDVYCKPVGWLGQFSRSQSTGIWHCTSEEIHLWDKQH